MTNNDLHRKLKIEQHNHSKNHGWTLVLQKGWVKEMYIIDHWREL